MADIYASFNWEDPLNLADNLSEEEILVMDTARGYAQDQINAARARRQPQRDL